MNQKQLPAHVRKDELKKLIKEAASGDEEKVKRLISPFVSQDEKLIAYGISAKFGLIATYDFVFLTDRRIGDLEITPLTGNLNVEVAYLQKIDAFVLNQPAFSLILRLGMLLLYPLLILGAFMWPSTLGNELRWSPQFQYTVTAGIAVLAVVGLYTVINPALKRSYLRLRKSGLWLKLQGNPVGVLIFADRNKFAMLTDLTRKLSELKRQLDKEAM